MDNRGRREWVFVKKTSSHLIVVYTLSSSLRHLGDNQMYAMVLNHFSLEVYCLGLWSSSR
jgi:hypothetical protein